MNTLKNGTPEPVLSNEPAPEYTGTVEPDTAPPEQYTPPVEAVPGVGGIPGVGA
jgi:hypothetical protein